MRVHFHKYIYLYNKHRDLMERTCTAEPKEDCINLRCLGYVEAAAIARGQK